MIDIHVHYFPPRVFEAIWTFFESQGHGLWPIQYKLHGDEHRAELKRMGVSRFTTLVYAHKPGLASYLNEFVRTEAQEHAELIPFGTIFAGDGHVGAVAEQLFIHWNFFGIKLHPFVSGEALDDSRLFPAYEIMQAERKILICHPASAPVYTAAEGATRLRRILQQFPQLRIVVAHCGAYEYVEYTNLADDFEHVYFDTAMNCVDTHVFKNNCPGPSFFMRYSDRILFGSDYPNIPYPYELQIEGIQCLGLGPELEHKVFQGNAERLLGSAARPTP